MYLINGGMDNKTNGAVTSYNFTFTPNTFIQNDDKIMFTFPPEILLSHDKYDQTYMTCTADIRYIRRIECLRDHENTVTIKLKEVTSIVAGITIKIEIYDIRNAPSLRPSNDFTNFQLMDAGNYPISGYGGRVYVANSYVSNITEFELV